MEDWLRVAGDSIQNGHAPTGTTKIVLAGDEIAAAAMRLNDDGTLPPGAVKTMFETLEKQYGKIFEIRKFKLFAP
ncbi:hypothetical protein [Tuwongella immobilis]|uniref:hypothetical protein n=1 Tax=Tuwongella immobilis TaxID=692036 RepID=UPI0013A6D256|nr:hypothetical protein [Tuwongella immobilis]